MARWRDTYMPRLIGRLNLSPARRAVARRVFVDHEIALVLLGKFYMPLEIRMKLVGHMSACLQIALMTGEKKEALPGDFTLDYAHSLMQLRMQYQEQMRRPGGFVRKRIVWDEVDPSQEQEARHIVHGLVAEGWKLYCAEGDRWWSVKGFEECRERGEIVVVKHGVGPQLPERSRELYEASLTKLFKKYGRMHRILSFWRRQVEELYAMPA